MNRLEQTNIESGYTYPYVCASDGRCHISCGIDPPQGTEPMGSLDSPECQECIWNECGPSPHQVTSDNVCGYFNCSKDECPRCALHQECQQCGTSKPNPYPPNPYPPNPYPPNPICSDKCISGDYQSRQYCCERTLTPQGCPLCPKGCTEQWNGVCTPGPFQPLECGNCIGCMTPSGCYEQKNLYMGGNKFDCKDFNPSWTTCSPPTPQPSENCDQLQKKYDKCDAERTNLWDIQQILEKERHNYSRCQKNYGMCDTERTKLRQNFKNFCTLE